jgi:hypothetical protein
MRIGIIIQAYNAVAWIGETGNAGWAVNPFARCPVARFGFAI